MRLHESKLAPNPRRVRIFLAEKGVTIDDVVQYDILKGDNLAEDFLSRNVFGKLPALELDDGTVIAETIAICRYFEELHPEPALFGTGAKQRAIVDMWQRHAEWDGLLPIGLAFRNAFPGFKDRGFAGVPEPTPQVPDIVEPAGKLAMRTYGIFDQRLGEREFLAGDDYSVADITAFVGAGFAKLARLDVIGDDRPNLRRWYETMKARPSAKA